MRSVFASFAGALVAASCLVPNYDLVDSFDDGGDEPGGQGGSSGQAGSAGSDTGGTPTGGASGTAGCGVGLAPCGAECVNLGTDPSNCGACDMPCPAGDVCFEGSCENDCGALSECGASCVDLQTDEKHCGECDTPCLGECIAGDCDLSCPNGRLRCDELCCNIPPAHAVATCQANTCGLECDEGYHDCGSSPFECFANDETRCGPDCADCSQPNATVACVDTDTDGSNDVCRNTCLGYEFACAGPAPGKPACGSWDFESETTEGWTIWNMGESDLTAPPSAFMGNFLTRTSFRTSGLRAMSADFDGDGTDKFGIQFRIGLCGGGEAVNLSGRRMTFDIQARTQSGFSSYAWNDGPNYFLTMNGEENIGGPGSDFNMASDEWVTATLDYTTWTDPLLATHIVFWFRVFNVDWRGTVFIDNIRFE